MLPIFSMLMENNIIKVEPHRLDNNAPLNGTDKLVIVLFVSDPLIAITALVIGILA
jgi:hypothetical protein